MSNGFLSQQEIDDYSPEFVDVMRRVAAETAAPLQTEIQNLRGQLSHVQQETGQAFLDRMNRELTALVGDWQTMNRHGPFISWAQGLDPFSAGTS